MPAPTSAVTSSRAMLKNATNGITTYSRNFRMPRAQTPARAPRRRSASTPAAIDAAMARAIQSTARRLCAQRAGTITGRLRRSAVGFVSTSQRASGAGRPMWKPWT